MNASALHCENSNLKKNFIFQLFRQRFRNIRECFFNSEGKINQIDSDGTLRRSRSSLSQERVVLLGSSSDLRPRRRLDALPVGSKHLSELRDACSADDISDCLRTNVRKARDLQLMDCPDHLVHLVSR